MFTRHFSQIPDPRQEGKILYPLEEILLITVCAVIGGADNWVEIIEDVKLFIEDEKKNYFSDRDFNFHETVNSDHGRIETRRYGVTEDISCLQERHNWSGLTSIGFVESTREIGGRFSVETRYYISSIKTYAVQLAEGVRGHWGIENRLHWIMDVNFRDDSCRIRKDNAPHNFTIIKHMANNLIRKEISTKKSINVKKRVAGWSNNYLMKVITQ